VPRSGIENQDLIRQQLERLLASPTFARTRRSSQLVQFLVEAALTGKEQDLKEYVIATAVFQSIVVVEVTKAESVPVVLDLYDIVAKSKSGGIFLVFGILASPAEVRKVAITRLLPR
jgi:hypothetical protein